MTKEQTPITLVVIDDDPDDLRATARILEHAGYRVITGVNAAQALELTRLHRPVMLLLDVVLPDGNGVDIARQLKSESGLAGVFVILISGIKTSSNDQAAGLAAGLADGYITRPFSKTEFLARIDAMLRLRSAQEALREALGRLQKIANLVPGVVYQYRLRPDGSSCLPYASEAIRDIYHVSPQQVLDDASPLFTVMHQGDHDAVVASIQISARDLTPWRQEYRVKFEDGSIRWLFGEAVPEREQDGGTLWHGFITDITERKKTELALLQSEKKYRQMVENSPDVVYVYSVRKGSIFYSPKVLEVLGYSEEHLCKNPFLWAQSIHPDDRAAVVQAHDELRKGSAFKIQYRIKNARDEWRWLFDRSTGSREEYGDLIVDGLAMDITESKQAADRLRASETRSQTIIQTALDGFWITDLQGYLLQVNAAYCRMSGYSEQELLGTHISKLEAKESSAEIGEHIQTLMAQGWGRFETRHRHKDGSVFDVKISIQYQAVDGGRMVCFLSDITERKRLELQEHEVVLQLERAVLGTVDAISKMVDLRDPYTSGHERRVGEIAAAIAAEMGLDADTQRGLRVAGAVHDIGKIAVPTEILGKPGRISAIELAIVKTHAQEGYEVLSGIDFPWPVAEVARQHHERIDGSGYPQGLKGEEIVLEARILAVADVVEAMASDRPYRPGAGIDKALAEIERGRGTAYDANAGDACLRLFRDKGYSIPA